MDSIKILNETTYIDKYLAVIPIKDNKTMIEFELIDIFRERLEKIL